MIRVALADDQELVRTGFRLIVSAEPDLEVVGEAANGREAVDLVRARRPDVVLMDVRMPVLDGIEATRRVAAQTRVVVLTTFDLDSVVFEAIRAGASGFLLKTAPADELVRAVRVAAAGDSLLSPSVTRRLVEEFARRPAATQPQGLEELTPRERPWSCDSSRGVFRTPRSPESSWSSPRPSNPTSQASSRNSNYATACRR